MRIWFDLLTPKQLLFFEPMARDLGRRNEVLCTSRRYREVSTLAGIRGFPLVSLGRYGGGDRLGKLEASAGRTKMLVRKVSGFSPDLAVSFCSPDAARVAFGLGTDHVAFTETPHAVPVMRLTVPLVQKLITTWIIPKREFTKFGIAARDIVHYRGIDSAHTSKRAAAGAALPRAPGKKTVLVRAPEVQSSYAVKTRAVDSIVEAILGECGEARVVVLARYAPQKRALEGSFGRRIKVINMSYDGKALLEGCDAFVGSGGTMTAESAFMGVPTISYDAVPNYVERYLVRKGLAVRERDPGKLASRVAAALASGGAGRERARREVAAMEDPYSRLIKVMGSLGHAPRR